MSSSDQRPLRSRGRKQTRRQRADYQLYESMKAAWDRAHPRARHDEREAAIAQIAAACGI